MDNGQLEMGRLAQVTACLNNLVLGLTIGRLQVLLPEVQRQCYAPPHGARGELSSETGTLSGDERSTYHANANNPIMFIPDKLVSETVYRGVVGEPVTGPALQMQQNFLEQEGFVLVCHSVVFCTILRSDPRLPG